MRMLSSWQAQIAKDKEFDTLQAFYNKRCAWYLHAGLRGLFLPHGLHGLFITLCSGLQNCEKFRCDAQLSMVVVGSHLLNTLLQPANDLQQQ